MAGVTTTVSGMAATEVHSKAEAEPIIDIHQHLGYTGRPDDVLLRHQRAMGITTTIIRSRGRLEYDTFDARKGVEPVQGQCLGNEAFAN